MLNLKISNKLFMVLVGVFVLIVLLFGLDKCGRSEKVKQLEKENKELSDVLEMSRKVSMNTIGEKEDIITKQDEKIEELLVTIEDKNRELAVGASEITEVEEAFDDTAPLKEQIVNLKQQVALWKSQFQIATEIIAEKDEIIFSLTQKYDAQVVISNEWKGLYEDTMDLKVNLDLQIKFMKRQINRVKFGSGIKSTLILVAAGFFVYSMVK